MTERGWLERERVLWSVAGILGLIIAYRFQASFRDPVILGGLILIEMVLVSLWHYEAVYFPFLMAVFVWAGTAMPFGGYMMTARWPVLAVGAIAGAVLWLRGKRQSFTA